jgi:ATP-binding cassette, subfamily B, bacterial
MMLGGGGPFMGGPTANETNAAAGLPFAGVPSELRERAEQVLATEPTHPEPVIDFTQSGWDRRRLTVGSMLRPHFAKASLALLLVVAETLSSLVGPLLFSIGIDRGVRRADHTVLLVVAGIYIGSLLVNAVVNRARIRLTTRLGESMMYDLRVRVFSHLQRLSLDFYTDEKSGVLLSRMTSDVDVLTALLQDGIVNLVVQLLTIVVVTAILFALDPLLALILVVSVVPLLLGSTLWFRSASARAYDKVRERIAGVLADLQESLGGIRVIAAHNRRRHNVIHHRNVVGEYQDANLETARVATVYGPFSEAVGIVGQAVILGVGGKMVLDGRLLIGELTAFVLYLTTFFAPIQQLVQLYNTYQQGSASIRKLGGLLATEPTVAEADDAVELPPVRGEIRLEHVDFAYDAGVPVLRDVDLTIEEGETVAFVGATGAGKSTIAKLVARFHDPDQGRVLVDGHDLRTVTLRSLRAQLGLVPQEPFLFHGTIRDNVAFGRPDATDEDVEEACRAVGLGDVLDRHDGGVGAPVHERGASLSAGERQLFALARAFLARPRILVLDEATSSLDLASEQRIEDALDVVLQGRTAILVAHRLATARRADRIAVVHDGRIVELGSHEELVARGGRYAQLDATWQRHMGSPAGHA